MSIGVQTLPQPERVQTYPGYIMTRNGGKPMNGNYSTTEAKASERISNSNGWNSSGNKSTGRKLKQKLIGYKSGLSRQHKNANGTM